MLDGNHPAIGDLIKVRRQEILCQCERDQLAQQIKPRRRPVRFYRPLLAKVGIRLVGWGERLQAQYEVSQAL